MFPRLRIPRIRFSLLTLLLLVLLVGACAGLYYKWEPWAPRLRVGPPEPHQESNKKSPTVFSAMEAAVPSPDGKYLAVRWVDFSKEFHVSVFDLETKRYNQTIDLGPFLPDYDFEMGFSPASSFLWVSRRSDRFFRAWRLKDGMEIAPQVPVSIDAPWLWHFDICCFSYDDNWITLPDGDSLYLSNTSTGERSMCLWSREEPDTVIMNVVFSKNGDMVAVAEGNGNECSVLVWDLVGKRLIRRLRGDGVSFLADGNRVMVSDPPDCTRVYRLDSGKEVFCVDGVSYLESQRLADLLPNINAISPDQKKFVTCKFLLTYEFDAYVWDLESGRKTGTFPALKIPGALRNHVITRDGQRIVCTTPVQIRSVDGAALSEPMGVGALSWDHLRMASMYSREGLVVVDVESGRELCRIATGYLAGFNVVRFSSNGELVTVHRDCVQFWSRRRPEYWWGLAWLPEFWISLLSSGALLFIAARNIRCRSSKSPTAPTQQPAADSQ